MTVGELFAAHKGPVLFRIGTDKPPLAPSEFWHRYRTKPEWQREVEGVNFDVWGPVPIDPSHPPCYQPMKSLLTISLKAENGAGGGDLL